MLMVTLANVTGAQHQSIPVVWPKSSGGSSNIVLYVPKLEHLHTSRSSSSTGLKRPPDVRRKDAVQSALHLVFKVTIRGLPSTRGSWRYIHTRGGFCGTRRAAEDPSRRGVGSMLP